MLKKLLDKYSASLEELDEAEETLQDFPFTFSGSWQKQLLYRTFNRINYRRDILMYRRGHRNTLVFRATKAEALDAECAFAAYCKAWEEFQKLSFNAFIAKNKIWSHDDPNIKSADMSDEEWIKLEMLKTAAPHADVHRLIEA